MKPAAKRAFFVLREAAQAFSIATVFAILFGQFIIKLNN